MRYQVPQFIEIEDKIFGPLTIKQFVYLAGGAAVSYLVYALLNAYIPIFLIIILILPIAGFAVALAFYKINGKPFINVVESAVKYYIGSKLYIWKKEAKKVATKEEATAQKSVIVPRLADSKLKDLAWNLDISKGKDKNY
jgi:hypothetical protein